MSIQPQSTPPIPPETIAVARAAFPKGNLYMQLRDTLGIIYEDEAFTPLFSRRGQPAQSPWRLALICVMQYVENLSDRQAADAVRARIDWKYALSLPLSNPGFDFSILSEFRSRLLTNGWEQFLWLFRAFDTGGETLLNLLVEPLAWQTAKFAWWFVVLQTTSGRCA